MKSTFERIKKIQEILDDKSVYQEHAKLPYWRRVVHFWVLVAKSFTRNRGPVRAAALAYTTVLSLIPMLAVVVSVSTGFLQNDKGNTVNNLLDKFVAYVAPQLNLIQSDEETGAMNREAVVQKIQGYIETVNSGALGLTAGLVLVFIAVTVLSTVETTLNDIWGVSRGRSWSARVIQYWAAITLGPIMIITATALTSVGAAKEKESKLATTNAIPLLTNVSTAPISTTTSQIQMAAKIAQTPVATNLVPVKPRAENIGFFQRVKIFFEGSVLGPLLSFVILSIFLTLLYELMPATRVRWGAALFGGVVAGGLLQLNNLLNVIYLSKVVTYSKIYGSLGAVPIFLLGLYFSWMIILLGAQVAYAFQNRQAYMQERQAEKINQRGREFVALRLMTYVAQKFISGQKPATQLGMSNALGIPSQLACEVLKALVARKLVVEVKGEETGYAPARPIEKISVDDILSALRVGNGTELATSDDPTRAILREQFDRIVLAETHAAGSVSLQNLVTRAASLPPSNHPEAAAA